MVTGAVDIDMSPGRAGLCICDENAPLLYRRRLLSQAEHDPLAASVLITTSPDKAHEIDAELERQTAYLSRREIITAPFRLCSAVVVGTLDDAAALSDQIAPEHSACGRRSLRLLSNTQRRFGFPRHMTPSRSAYMAGPTMSSTGGPRASPPRASWTASQNRAILFGDAAFFLPFRDVVALPRRGADAHANSIRILLQRLIQCKLLSH